MLVSTVETLENDIHDFTIFSGVSSTPSVYGSAVCKLRFNVELSRYFLPSEANLPGGGCFRLVGRHF